MIHNTPTSIYIEIINSWESGNTPRYTSQYCMKIGPCWSLYKLF